MLYLHELKDFGTRLKTAFKQSAYTQKQISEIIRISQDTLSNYVKETTYPDADVLYKLIKLLNVSADWLLTGEGKEFTKLEELSDEKFKAIIELLKRLPEETLDEVQKFLEFKLYELQGKAKKGRSSNYTSGEEAATYEEMA